MSRTLWSSGIFVATLGFASLFSLHAADRIFTERIESVGRDVKVMERVTGKERSQIVELSAGARYQRNGRWEETVEEIRIDELGAVADTGPHRVRFKGDIYEQSPVEISLAGDLTLKNGVVGIAYFDEAAGRSILLAEVKPAQGYVDGLNRVVYPDAFDGLLADVRYTYMSHGIEQDVILRRNPPSPKVYGLNPETTRLEVWTEFFEGEPTERKPHGRSGTKKARKDLSGEEIIDETLKFGSYAMVRGRAFSLDADGVAEEGLQPVGKRWLTIDGRNILVESVPYPGAEQALLLLPDVGVSNGGAGAPAEGRLLPLFNPGRERAGSLAVHSGRSAPGGYVIDFLLVANQTDFTFAANVTYFVNGPVYLDGTTTFEGGAVVKFAKDTSARLNIEDYLVTTSTGTPIILTAEHDNSIGDSLGTSPQSGRYGNYLSLSGVYPATWQYFEFRFAASAISFGTFGGSYTVQNSAFYGCTTGVSGYDTTVTLNSNNFCHVSAPHSVPYGTVNTSGITYICSGDRDSDGYTDDYEISSFDSFNEDADTDFDGDGIDNGAEISLGLDPTAEDTDGDGMPDGWEVAYGLNAATADGPIRTLDFSTADIVSYGTDSSQDTTPTLYEVAEGGRVLKLVYKSNSWKAVGMTNLVVATNTTLRLHYRSYRKVGEIQGVGVDADLNVGDTDGIYFKLAGNQSSGANTAYENYWASGERWKFYPIRVGQHKTGTFHYATFFNDNDAGHYAFTYFKDVAIGPDDDGDGAFNLEEYYLGTDPTVADDWEVLFADGDVDNDGVNNYTEYLDGTNPGDPDTDYDGRSDGQEKVDGTDPVDPDDVANLRLGYWSFDDHFLGDNGQAPNVATGGAAIVTNGVAGGGMHLNTAVYGGIARYNLHNEDGSANFNLRRGSVRFWFKPDWNGANNGGSGPAAWGRLWNVGAYTSPATNGYLIVHTDPNGNQMLWSIQTNSYTRALNGVGSYVFSSNSWTQITVTYDSTSAKFYTNGVLASQGVQNNNPYFPGSGMNYWPVLDWQEYGFTLGSDHAGGQQGEGTYDELETFNYPLSAAQIASDYAGWDNDQDGMLDSWERTHFGDLSQGAHGDYDADGASNLQEYLASTDPATGNGVILYTPLE